jgi:hypothetical protein
MMAGRTDTHQLTVCNNTTGQRHSFAGTKKLCEKEAAARSALWKGDKLEILIGRRKG